MLIEVTSKCESKVRICLREYVDAVTRFFKVQMACIIRLSMAFGLPGPDHRLDIDADTANVGRSVLIPPARFQAGMGKQAD
jgi:hypothetical protein